jgi:membrane protease YdiL (CAAX protease family)
MSADDFPVTILRLLSGIGPMLSAIVLVYSSLGAEDRRNYWRRMVTPANIALQWWAIILLTPLVLMLISGLLDSFFGGAGLGLEAPIQEFATLGQCVTFVLFILVFGPIPEEMGWRGYALDGLQERHTALVSNLILGAFWALWHFPLFFIEGTYQARLGVLTPAFWIYMVVMIPMSILIGWVYNNTGRSILSAMIFHFSINLTGEILSLSPKAERINLAIWILAALIVVLFYRPQTLKGMNSLSGGNLDKTELTPLSISQANE